MVLNLLLSFCNMQFCWANQAWFQCVNTKVCSVYDSGAHHECVLPLTCWWPRAVCTHGQIWHGLTLNLRIYSYASRLKISSNSLPGLPCVCFVYKLFISTCSLHLCQIQYGLTLNLKMYGNASWLLMARYSLPGLPCVCFDLKLLIVCTFGQIWHSMTMNLRK